jgi:hypothetical protein
VLAADAPAAGGPAPAGVGAVARMIVARPTFVLLVAQVRETPSLGQKLDQLQTFIAVFPPECMGQIASSGPT